MGVYLKIQPGNVSRPRIACLAALVVAVGVAFSGSAHALEASTAAVDINDAGPKPSNVLPAILANLKKTMKDPYSIRDFRLCEPKVTAAFKYPGAGERWEPAHWSVAFELNAKNGFGAYAGRTYFSANYKTGSLTDVGSPNLGANLNAKLLELTEACPRVPDEDIQKLISD